MMRENYSSADSLSSTVVIGGGIALAILFDTVITPGNPLPGFEAKVIGITDPRGNEDRNPVVSDFINLDNVTVN